MDKNRSQKSGYYVSYDIVGVILRYWRKRKVLPRLRGTLVDLACGDNYLVKEYGSGTGVDISGYGDNVLIVKTLKCLPFDDASVDTITIIASLNYFHEPVKVLREVHRILKNDGQLILTMSNTYAMKIWHRFREPHAHRSGYSTQQVQEFLQEAGFTLREKHFFMFFLNAIYIANKMQNFYETGKKTITDSAQI